MNAEIANEIEKAQAQLHEDIHSALVKFSQSTGLCVSCVHWSVDKCYNHSGKMVALAYSNFDTDIKIATGNVDNHQSIS